MSCELWLDWMLVDLAGWYLNLVFSRNLNSVVCIAWLVKQIYLAKDHELCMSWMIGSRNLTFI